MTELIVKGKEFKSGTGNIDVDFRFYRKDGAPIMYADKHLGQVSSSFSWAKIDTHRNYDNELKELFPDGYVIEFQFSELDKDFGEIEQLFIPNRDLISELAAFGLDEAQCKKVLDWTETLPIHVYMGINYTQVSITQGVVVVQPNQDTI